MMDDTPVDMDASMTEEEWAIWRAAWSVPEVRRRCGIDHYEPLTYEEIGQYMGVSDKAVWAIQDMAMLKIKVALNRYIIQQEINRQQHSSNQS